MFVGLSIALLVLALVGIGYGAYYLISTLIA